MRYEPPHGGSRSQFFFIFKNGYIIQQGDHIFKQLIHYIMIVSQIQEIHSIEF
jgi:hypothetical protein